MWFTRLALRNPVLILMLSLMTIVLGWVSLTRLSVDLFPDINIPNVRVATFYAGAGPEDVEKAITLPIERAVSACPGVDRVESVSKQGVSAVTVWFQYGTNLDTAQFDVQQRVGQILNTLPPGVGQPLTLKFDITNIPVVQVAMTGDGVDEKQLYDLANNVVEPQLERLPGVASATVSGGRIREIQVRPDLDALRARNLSVLEVVGALRSANLILPSGNLRTQGRDYNVFTNTQVRNLEQLRDVVIAQATSPDGRPVRVGDVAEVIDGAADQSEVVRVNGTRGVFFRVLKQPGANTIAVVDAVRAALPSLRGVPPNVRLGIGFDQSNYIRSAVAALQHEALIGGALAVLIILLFLVSFRATGIVAVAIPLSIIATFVLLYFTGQTLNVFTLGGLALGIGRLVDDSIVELENIHRHLHLGQSRKDAVLLAAQEVAMPILVSTITTIVVFFPVLFLQGIARNLFIPLALTISFSLTMSFFVSRTVTPLLCLFWLKPDSDPTAGLGGAILGFFKRIDDGYARALSFVLKHRVATVSAIVVVLASSVFAARRVGTEFFPEADEAQFSVNFRTPIGTQVLRTEEASSIIEDSVRKSIGVRGEPAGAGLVTTMITSDGLPQGRTALFSGNSGPHAGSINVNLVPKHERAVSDVQALEGVRKSIGEKLPGTLVTFFNGGMVKRILNFGSSAPIDVEILGYDPEVGQAYAKQMAQKLRALSDEKGAPLLTDVLISREENYPQFDVEVDREKAGVLGISEQQVAQTVLTSLVGNTQYAPIPFTDEETGREYFINVRPPDRFRSHELDLKELQLKAPSGKLVSLDTVATVKRNSGPVTISRRYLERVIDVTANVAPGQDLGTAAAAVQGVLDELTPPDGFATQQTGQAAAQKQAFSGLGFAMLLAIALVYMVLASQFRSLVDPLVIMFSVPLGISGVFTMLWATGTTLSVNSFMGIIMMIGIVVSNGVLLVDFTNVLRRRGHPMLEAVVEAGRTRLRPILMTTIATLVGLLPMALGVGEGSETNLPLARAVIGGLTVSTALTLFLVPILYTWLDRFAKRRSLDEDEDEPKVAPAHEVVGAAHG